LATDLLTFSTLIGESPKQFGLRLRLTRAAAALLTTTSSVLDIALSCGFESHAGFSRAFTRRFGMSPHAYRSQGFSHHVDAAAVAAHADATESAAPCLRLFHAPTQPRPHSPKRIAMSYSMERKHLASQPVLVVRSRIKRSEIAQAIPAALPLIFEYAQQHRLPITGHPFTRYVQVGHGLMTIEVGMRVASGTESLRVDPASVAAIGAFEDQLPEGPAATTVHHGPYDGLPKAYEALEAWMEAEGLQPAGPPWESYITDPAEYPDPNDWQTEICWPIR
jgi:effector-binding domain-containing protein